MSSENIGYFNLLLTAAIAQLYDSHPATISLDPGTLWKPPLDRKDPNFSKKVAAAHGTVDWLYRNDIVGGNFQRMGSDFVAITNAQLTARGYRIANASENNADDKPLGQVAIEAMSNPASADGENGIVLVARRFTEA